jgi:PQQ-like domain
MKVLTLVLLIALAFAVSAQQLVLAQQPAVQAQQPADQSSAASEQKAFNTVEVSGEGFRSFFVFSSEPFHYTIRADGFAESDSGQRRRTNFNLRVGRNGYLVRVYFAEYESDLLLIYEASDKQYGWGYVERLDQKTSKPRWLKSVSGFNIGPGLVEGNYAYLSAADLLVKIDLRSGDFVWQQQGFEKQNALSSEGFRLPSINGERVLFQDDVERGKTIEVDKTTGKILNVRN